MDSKQDQRFPTSLTIAYVLVAAAIYAASFYPETRLWGINLYGYFGDWAALTFLGINLALLLILSLRTWPTGPAAEASGNSARFVAFALTGTAILGVCFYLFRGQTHFLGDGAQLLSWLEEGIHNKPWERGTYRVQSIVYTLLGGDGKETAHLALQLVSIVAGLVALVVTAWSSLRLFKSNWSRVFFFLGLANSGQMLLYFGYIESYPLFVSAVTVFVMVGLMAARGLLNKWWLLPLLVLCGYLHIFALGLIPATVYLLLSDTNWWRERIGGNRRAITLLIVGPFLLGAAALVYLYNTSYFFRFVVVPPFNGPLVVESYTMFSGKHLLDCANLLLQHMPALPLMAIALVSLPLAALRQRRELWFLGVLTATVLTMVFLINPGLGMPRDWDLFAFAGVPLSALVFFLLANGSLPRSIAYPVSIAAIVLGASLLIPRVAIQVIPEKGIELVDNFSKLDWIRNRNARFFVNRYISQSGDSLIYRHRSLNSSQMSSEEHLAKEGIDLIKEGRVRGAVARFKQSLDIAPNYAYAWTNLGVAYTELGDFDSALVCLKLSDALSSFNPTTNFNLGTVYLAQENAEKAEEHLSYAIELKDDHFSARWRLVQLYRQQGREEAFLELLTATAERVDSPLEFVRAAGDHYVKNGQYDEARKQYKRALGMGMDSSIVIQIQGLYPQLRLIDTTGL